MSTTHDTFAQANKHLSGASQTTRAAIEALSPEQRRKAARGNLDDIRRLTSRYVSRDGQIDREGLMDAWAEVVARAKEIQFAISDPATTAHGVEAIEQLVLTVSEISKDLKGVR
jgi:uncharacterized membrane protein